MNRYSYLEKLNSFKTPPIDFEDWGISDYADELGIERHCYQLYRYFVKDFIQSDWTVMDIKCGTGISLHTLKKEFNLKKCIGYNSIQSELETCKNGYDDISFYKDFLLSKQKNANLIIAIDSFSDYDNKSALLLRLSQALTDDGYLCIIQGTDNEYEYMNYIKTLERVHGLSKIYHSNISQHILNGIDKVSRFTDGSYAVAYADVSKNLINYSDTYKYFVTIMKNNLTN